MHRQSRLVVALLVCGAAVLSCQPPPPKFAFTYGEKHLRLDNGLRVIIVPDKTTELVEVDVRYEVGSKEDPAGKAGLAHLVEHLMFNLKPDGPETPPLMQYVNQLSTFFNAYTNWDSTHYQTQARSEMLDAVLKVEAMRLFYNGCKTPEGQFLITDEEFLREREVVRNEIRQRGGTADGQIPQLVMSAVYPKGHAYEQMIGGDDKQLTSISREDACAWAGAHYVPERATVIIAGGVDVAATEDMVLKWFGKLQKRQGAPLKEVSPLQVKGGRVTHELDIERPVLVVAWPLPPRNTKEGEVALFGLNGLFGSIAMAANRYEFATSVDATLLGGQLAPIMAIIVELRSLSNYDEALEFVWKATKQAHRGWDEGTWKELEIAKAQAKADFVSGIEPLGSRTQMLGEKVQFDKDLQFDSDDSYVLKEFAKIDQFEGSYVGSVVKKVVDRDRAKVILFKANKEGLKGDARSKVKFSTKTHEGARELPEVDPREAKRPLKVSTELKTMNGARRFELGNGLKVALLAVDAMPIVSMRMVFDVGDAHSGGSPGLADAAASFLSPSHHFGANDALSVTGTQINCGTTSDFTVCSTRNINIYLDVMLKGMERMIVAGEYNQRAIENWQKTMKDRYKSKTLQEELEFQRQLLAALYGPDHPYTKNGVLSPSAIAAIGYDEVNAFRKKHYSAANATLIVAGNFDLDKAESMIRSTFGGWSKGHNDEPIDPTPRTRTGAEFVGVVAKPGPQMRIGIAYPAPAGIDGQEAARQVLAEMLNQKMGDLRFKLGSTYGVYAGRSPRRGPTSYSMGGTVDAERAGESLKVMRDGVASLRRGEDFDVPFVRARRKLIEDLLGESTVSYELASRLGFIANYGLDPSYYNTLLQQIAAVSPAQVKALIASELPPEHEVVVALADRPALEKAFNESGIKDFKLVEPEYK